jgi:cysteine-S-conjugate beta-lyase
MTVPEDKTTALIHHAYEPPAGFRAPQVGVFKASTVIFPTVAAARSRDWRRKSGYTYGLHGTPTTFTLEERIATLEGGTASLLTPSGLSAVALVGQALLAHGDEVLLPANVYGPSREFARRELARWGITHRLYDALDAPAFEAMLSGRTKLVWIEAAGSVTMEFPDVRRLAAAARQRGAVVAFDDTWGAGIALDAFACGADVVVQALTKYPSGGGDVLMGAVTTRDAALHEQIKLTHMRLGLGVGANDAELVLRSLPSLALRYRAQDEAARAVAGWLQRQPEVAHLLHPAFEGSPGHEHWRSHANGAAGLFSVVFDERFELARVDAFVDALRRFAIGWSWAGPVSLAAPYDLRAIRAASPWPGHLVRFSIGLEAPADLIADLEQALEKALR